MYPQKYNEFLKLLSDSRAKNIANTPPLMSSDEKEKLLSEFHPDYKKSGFEKLSIGVNKGEYVPKKLCSLLQGKSITDRKIIDLQTPDLDTDVLIIGGGGAGAAAAIEAKKAGASVMIVTKLRMGDSNTGMAEGGIQASDQGNDSPYIHFLDAYGGGHFSGKKELLKKLVLDGPESISWLNELGVEFDRYENGEMLTTHGGGTSRKRMHAAKDCTGNEIMRTLRDEIYNKKIPVIEYTSAVDLILDESKNAAGAVLMDMESNKLLVAKAKTVILATGGAGRLHYNDFPTSNHYGATADGLIIGYRAGAKLIYADSIQYHPTGVAFPQQLYGALVTEKARSLGAKLINKNGEVFVNPLETRDVTTASIIRECTSNHNGIETDKGFGVWLDTPMVDTINGQGTIEKRLPSMLRMFRKFGTDIRKEPILVYPTLHYQNGGIEIDEWAMSVSIKNLYVAGEASGGIHGRNRLMGNSLLDIIVFGRTAGKNAAKTAKETILAPLTLSHLDEFEKERKKANITDNTISPVLLPDYTHKISEI